MIDPAVEAEMKEKHPGSVALTAGGETVVVVAPSRPIWKRFRTVVASDDKRRPEGLEQLLRDCLVYPDQKALTAILDRKPGLSETFAAEVCELAGAGLEVDKNAF
jgi:hypothetical protein